MKKIYILLFVIVIASYCYSQDQSQVKLCNNEVGMDVTSLLSRFFNLNIKDTNYFEPAYYLNYKRYFKHFIIRAGFGFDMYYHKDVIPYSYYIYNTTIDTNINLKSYSFTYNFKLGIERDYNISKRLQLMYGLDLLCMLGNSKIQTLPNYYSEMIYSKTKSYSIGPSPFIGLKYNITDKFSIFTESFYYFYYLNSANTISYLPLYVTSALQVTDRKNTSKGYYSFFSNPISVHCAIKF